MRIYHLNLLVLSAGLLVLLAQSGTTAPQADEDVQQLTLADVNEAAVDSGDPVSVAVDSADSTHRHRPSSAAPFTARCS